MALVNDAIALAVGLARHFEGFRGSPYLCPAGIPTIGYGFTRYADGRVVSLVDAPIGREAGEALLGLLMSRFAVSALRLCPGADTAGRLAAVADFAYNLGCTRLAGSNIRVRVNRDDWGGVPGELRKWRLAGGKIARGLVLRREAEIALL